VTQGICDGGKIKQDIKKTKKKRNLEKKKILERPGKEFGC